MCGWNNVYRSACRRLGRGERGLQLVGMVGVIGEHARAVQLARGLNRRATPRNSDSPRAIAFALTPDRRLPPCQRVGDVGSCR